MALEIYTDGSFKKNCGAWAYVIVRDGQTLREGSGLTHTHEHLSSNHMEFHAAIEALKTLEPQSHATIYSDSRNLIDTMTLWIDQWKKLGWKKSVHTRKFASPIKNLDQLQILDNLAKEHTLRWQWVRSHAGQPFNERCDELCILARTVQNY